jgi:hypothetical protein
VIARHIPALVCGVAAGTAAMAAAIRVARRTTPAVPSGDDRLAVEFSRAHKRLHQLVNAYLAPPGPQREARLRLAMVAATVDCAIHHLEDRY